nr:MAG TPA: hypothetical protein [Caudoviricetes sp.]
MPFGGGRAGWTLSVANAPFRVAVANSLQAFRRLWVGWHVLFHVCGWCHRLWGPRPCGVAGVII